MTPSKRNPRSVCFCGHRKEEHTLYLDGGKNKKGSRFVCTKDGCNRWSYCDLNGETPIQKKRGKP